MSLATRLTSFFLAALAVVLLGFSLGLFLLTRAYLHRQADERLEAALNTVMAAVESEPDGLEWEPRHHELSRWAGVEHIYWEVRSDAGQLVGRSGNHGAGISWPEEAAHPDQGDRGAYEAGRAGARWQVAWHRLRMAEATPRPGPGHHAELLITAGVPLEPLYGSLRSLATTLIGLSLVLWIAALLVGRWLGRRALAPVVRMAATARGMGAEHLHARLPGPGTEDELEDLCGSFNGLLGRLQEAFERQRRFTGDASHQLRTPLAAMLGQLEVALRRDRSASAYREVLEMVYGQANHLRQMVEALLFLARADAEAVLGELAPLDLVSWASDHLDHWSDHPRRPDLRLEVSAVGGLWVRAQVALLDQLVDNLLDNAVKYSASGQPVTLRLDGEDGSAKLAVTDQGAGITAADLPHVFEPFYRSSSARCQGTPGVGLGLAVAQRIAAVFGGTLSAERTLNGGSRFTLCLPRTAESRVPQFVAEV